jgi:hypothetical protein
MQLEMVEQLDEKQVQSDRAMSKAIKRSEIEMIEITTNPQVSRPAFLGARPPAEENPPGCLGTGAVAQRVELALNIRPGDGLQPRQKLDQKSSPPHVRRA